MESTVNALLQQFGYTGNHAKLLSIYAADEGRTPESLAYLAESLQYLSAYTTGLLVHIHKYHERAQAHGWQVVSPRTARWEQLTGLMAHECPPCKRHHLRHGEVDV